MAAFAQRPHDAYIRHGAILKNWREIKNVCLGDQGKFYRNTYTTKMNKFRCYNAKLCIYG